jgi:hypothetical protein
LRSGQGKRFGHRIADGRVNPGAPEIDFAGAEGDRAYAPADAIAGLDDEHLSAGAARRVSGRQACDTRSDHDHAHGSGEATWAGSTPGR